MSAKVHAMLPVLSPAVSVRDARDGYLANNGFTLAGYTELFATFNFFGAHITIPNTAHRRRALPFHDLHHLALGFGTDVFGEWEVSAWEARNGLPGYGIFVRLIVLQGLLMGLVFSHKRTLAAWRAAARHRSLYTAPVDYERLLAMSMGELRAHLGVPQNGIALVEPRAHADAPLVPAPFARASAA